MLGCPQVLDTWHTEISHNCKIQVSTRGSEMIWGLAPATVAALIRSVRQPGLLYQWSNIELRASQTWQWNTKRVICKSFLSSHHFWRFHVKFWWDGPWRARRPRPLGDEPRRHRCAVPWGSRVFPGRTSHSACCVDELRSTAPKRW